MKLVMPRSLGYGGRGGGKVRKPGYPSYLLSGATLRATMLITLDGECEFVTGSPSLEDKIGAKCDNSQCFIKLIL